MSAYAKSWTSMMSCSRAKSTMRCIHARSTHVVVGLWGNDSTMTRGFGHADSHDSMRLAKNASASGTAGNCATGDGAAEDGAAEDGAAEEWAPLGPGSRSRRTWRTSAPANNGA